MAVVTRPTGARVEFTYLGELPSLRINTINPNVQAPQLLQLVDALALIQAVPVLDGFLSREVELTEA